MNLLIFCPLEIIFIKSIDSLYSFALSQLFDSRKNILKKFLGNEYLYNVTMLQGSLENWEERCLEKSSVSINFQATDMQLTILPSMGLAANVFWGFFSNLQHSFSTIFNQVTCVKNGYLKQHKKTSILQAKVRLFPKNLLSQTYFSNIV